MCSPSSRRARRSFRPLLAELEGRVVPSFLPPVAYGTGREPNSVVVEDFNGDGVLDLAVANSSFSGTVSVLLGNGDGSFLKAQDFPAGIWPRAVVAGDFNVDGVPDLAIAEQSFASTVSVLLGNGDGSFQDPLRSVSPAIPYSLATGDFNRDGLLDLVTADGCYPECGRVAVLLGNGDGTFQSRGWQEGASLVPTSLAVGDLDADGLLDLAVAGPGGDCGESCAYSPTRVFLGNGDGTLQPVRTLPAGVQSYGVVLGDFNADGLLDLAASFLSADPPVGVFLSNGDGSFQPAIPTYGVGAGYLAVGDLNADGLLDLVIASGQTVGVLIGNGDGSFQPPQVFPAGRAIFTVALGDFDGNAFPDVAATDPSSNAVAVLLNDGDWPGPGPAPGGPPPGSGLGPAAFDLLAGEALGNRRLVREAIAFLPAPEPLRVPADVPFGRTAGPSASTETAAAGSRQVVDQIFAVRWDALTVGADVLP